MLDAITPQEVAQHFTHSGGIVTRLTRRGAVPAGVRVGRLDRGGYLIVNYRGHGLLVHRLVWCLEHGAWPPGPLDHIDGSKTSNAPANLRLCTAAQNAANKPPRVGPYKGVRQRWKNGRFTAYFHNEHLGVFDTAEAAARAHDAAALKRFGEFARLNFGSTS